MWPMIYVQNCSNAGQTLETQAKEPIDKLKESGSQEICRSPMEPILADEEIIRERLYLCDWINDFIPSNQ